MHLELEYQGAKSYMLQGYIFPKIIYVHFKVT